jgi:hypothetical protein
MTKITGLISPEEMAVSILTGSGVENTPSSFKNRALRPLQPAINSTQHHEAGQQKQ